MRQLIYFVACTVDRFIAGPDDSFDFFLFEGKHMEDLVASYPETIPAHMRPALGARDEKRVFDTVLMGRRTYEGGSKLGITNPYPHLRQYLISRSIPRSPDPAVTLVNGDPVALVRELKQEAGLGIWLCGGGALAAALHAEIDQLILKVHPAVLGAGTPLFAGAVAPFRLELIESKPHDSGVIFLHYRRGNETPAPSVQRP